MAAARTTSCGAACRTVPTAASRRPAPSRCRRATPLAFGPDVIHSVVNPERQGHRRDPRLWRRFLRRRPQRMGSRFAGGKAVRHGEGAAHVRAMKLRRRHMPALATSGLALLPTWFSRPDAGWAAAVCRHRSPTTRRLYSYLAGAAEGEDVGWAGIQRLAEATSINGRPALNDRQTMASTAEDMVSWYRRALPGDFFKKPGTLVEFKRIQAMADYWSMSFRPIRRLTARAAASTGRTSIASACRAR